MYIKPHSVVIVHYRIAGACCGNGGSFLRPPLPYPGKDGRDRPELSFSPLKFLFSNIISIFAEI